MIRYFKNLDWAILISSFGLIVMGLVALYSSSHTAVSGGHTNYFMRQLIFFIVGTGIIVVLYFVPGRWIYELSYPAYILSLLLLILVLFFGHMGMGAERWLKFGPIRVQPSEFAKLTTILALSRYLSSERVDVNKLKHFIIAGAILFVPFALIVRQPDLGTSLAFMAIALPMFYWSGFKGQNVILILAPVAVMLASFSFYSFLVLMLLITGFLLLTRRRLVIIAINFIGNVLMGLITPILWNSLKPYQQNRIKIFINPESDPRGAGYQIIQSKVAIGSGGLLGKGFMQGSQTQLRFLPEQHTDFIFAVIGEEFGFVGISLGLLLFLILLLRIVNLAATVKNRFNGLVAIGFATLLGFHMVVNVGMTIGLLPVTGLPLPFVSYGGSALLTQMTMIGLLLNFYRNRFNYT
ncbi:MAG: rod shape-determining protein RodA [Calditrichia bacterium]